MVVVTLGWALFILCELIITNIIRTGTIRKLLTNETCDVDTELGMMGQKALRANTPPPKL